MNARLLTATLVLSTFASAQTQVVIDSGAAGCSEGAILSDGSPAAGDITFDYDPGKAWLSVTVKNTSPVLPGVSTPTITRVYFNAPTGTVTDAVLMWQFAPGSTQPAFVFGFDADAGDGLDPNRAACLGTFNFRLASGGIKDGIANADAVSICADLKDPPLTGPVTFVFQLIGPDVGNLRSDVFAASSSRGTDTPVNVAMKFDGANCRGFGTLGNGDLCRTAVFVRGSRELGDTLNLCVEGGEACRAFLGLSLVAGPSTIHKFLPPIGQPVLFTFDFGFFAPGQHEFCLPVVVPYAPELIGLPVYMTSLTHPVEGDWWSFADPYTFSVIGDIPQ